MITINEVELASNLAEKALEKDWADRPENILVEEKNGDTRYNAEAQDIFDDHYDYFYSEINKVKE